MVNHWHEWETELFLEAMDEHGLHFSYIMAYNFELFWKMYGGGKW